FSLPRLSFLGLPSIALLLFSSPLLFLYVRALPSLLNRPIAFLLPTLFGLILLCVFSLAPRLIQLLLFPFRLVIFEYEFFLALVTIAHDGLVPPALIVSLRP